MDLGLFVISEQIQIYCSEPALDFFRTAQVWNAIELMCYHCQVGGLWVALSSVRHSQVRALLFTFRQILYNYPQHI